MAADSTAMTYPATVRIQHQEHYGRFWAVPALGSFVKSIMLIPHIFLFYFVTLWIQINQLVLWIPVLFTGKYPAYGVSLMSGYMRWSTRIYAYALGLTDKYPPFGFGGPDYAVDVQVVAPAAPSRLWAIPAIGIGIKSILLIPHLIILSVLSAAVMLAQLIIWIPVLFTGHYPTWGRQLVGGFLGWSMRVTAYYYGLSDSYPPFSMEVAS